MNLDDTMGNSPSTQCAPGATPLAPPPVQIPDLLYDPLAIRNLYPIRDRDAAGIVGGAYLNNVAIMHLICEKGNMNSNRNIIDPSWWGTWVSENNQAHDDTAFFHPKLIWNHGGGFTTTEALVIPIEKEKHWAAVLIDLKENTAVVYNSHKEYMTIEDYQPDLQQFFETFRHHFAKDKQFVIESGTCSVQADVTSCGVYACENVIKLLNYEMPVEADRSPSAIDEAREMMEDELYELEHKQRRVRNVQNTTKHPVSTTSATAAFGTSPATPLSTTHSTDTQMRDDTLNTPAQSIDDQKLRTQERER